MAVEKVNHTNLKEIMKKCSIFTNNVPMFSSYLNPFFRCFRVASEFNHTLLQVFNSSPPITIELKSEFTLNVP